MKIHLALKPLVALVAGLTVAGAAQALPIINQWNYTLTGVWTDFAPDPGVNLSGSGKTLSWGTNGTSSLAITDPPAPGSVTTQISGNMPQPGTTAAGLTLTHNNQVIDPPSLTSAQLTATLTLDPSDPDFGALPSTSLNYDILFTETTNAEPCAANSPAGNPCNDIFVMTNGFLNQAFAYLGETYFINIFPISGGQLNVLTDAECAAAGAASGCQGFTTIEGQANTLAFGFTIATQRFADVPEPGTLALLGAALLAAGISSRRKTK